MRLAPLADVKARLSSYLEDVKTNGPIVITKNGRAAAVLLAPVDDDDLEGLLLARSPRLQAILNRSRRSVRAGRTVKHREFWKTVAERQKKKVAG